MTNSRSVQPPGILPTRKTSGSLFLGGELLTDILSDNFNLDSTGQVTSKERNTGEHRELQADGGQQGLETG